MLILEHLNLALPETGRVEAQPFDPLGALLVIVSPGFLEVLEIFKAVEDLLVLSDGVGAIHDIAKQQEVAFIVVVKVESIHDFIK